MAWYNPKDWFSKKAPDAAPGTPGAAPAPVVMVPLELVEATLLELAEGHRAVATDPKYESFTLKEKAHERATALEEAHREILRRSAEVG